MFYKITCKKDFWRGFQNQSIKEISFESEELKLFDEVIPSDGKVQEMVDMVEKPQDTNAPVYDPDEFYQSTNLKGYGLLTKRDYPRKNAERNSR